MDDNDTQKVKSAATIRDAIIDCISVLRAEEKKNYGGDWNDYIADLVDSMMDGVGDISGSLLKNVDCAYVPEYERLAGHEMGLTAGRC